jgi:hypothetical protein
MVRAQLDKVSLVGQAYLSVVETMVVLVVVVLVLLAVHITVLLVA